MILRAAREMNLDLSTSYMIGDTRQDIETARNAGVQGIFVRTGYGKNADVPHGTVYVAEDILGAVRWILKDRNR
jgi:D-glycero-D-manno-heptose 1,7-bisphosphate phosphatase